MVLKDSPICAAYSQYSVPCLDNLQMETIKLIDENTNENNGCAEETFIFQMTSLHTCWSRLNFMSEIGDYEMYLRNFDMVR